MSPLIRMLTAAMALSMFFSLSVEVEAQVTKKKAEPVKGTVISVEKAKTGRNFLVKMKDEDDAEFDVTVLPRTVVLITATGDHGYLKPGTILQGVFDNDDEFFSNKYTVVLGQNVQPEFGPKTDNPDESEYKFCGQIQSIKASGEQEAMEIQCGEHVFKIKCYPPALEIMLAVADVSFAKEGDAIEVDGTVVKGKKLITAKAVNVTSAKPIASEDYFASIEESKKSKTAKSTATKSKTKAGTKTDAEGKPATDGDKSDPFGLEKDKKSTKPKSDKPAKPTESTTDS